MELIILWSCKLYTNFRKSQNSLFFLPFSLSLSLSIFLSLSLSSSLKVQRCYHTYTISFRLFRYFFSRNVKQEGGVDNCFCNKRRELNKFFQLCSRTSWRKRPNFDQHQTFLLRYFETTKRTWRLFGSAFQRFGDSKTVVRQQSLTGFCFHPLATAKNRSILASFFPRVRKWRKMRETETLAWGSTFISRSKSQASSASLQMFGPC